MSRLAAIPIAVLALLTFSSCADGGDDRAIENFDYVGKSMSMIDVIDGKWHVGGYTLSGKRRESYLVVLDGYRVEREAEFGERSVDHVVLKDDSLFVAVNTLRGESRIYHLTAETAQLVAASDGYVLDLKAPRDGGIVAATTSDGDFRVAFYGRASRVLVHFDDRPIDFAVGESGETCVALGNGSLSEIRCFAPDGSPADKHVVEGRIRHIALTGDGSAVYVFERDGQTFLGSTDPTKEPAWPFSGTPASRPFFVSGCEVAMVHAGGASLGYRGIARSHDCGSSWRDSRAGILLTSGPSHLIGDTLYHYRAGRIAIP